MDATALATNGEDFSQTVTLPTLAAGFIPPIFRQPEASTPASTLAVDPNRRHHQPPLTLNRQLQPTVRATTNRRHPTATTYKGLTFQPPVNPQPPISSRAEVPPPVNHQPLSTLKPQADHQSASWRTTSPAVQLSNLGNTINYPLDVNRLAVQTVSRPLLPTRLSVFKTLRQVPSGTRLRQIQYCIWLRSPRHVQF